MNRAAYSLKLKQEIAGLQRLQRILQKKIPYYDFLEPLIGNAIATMADLLCYLVGKNPYFTEVNEPFFHNREAAMHRTFFSDMHVATEDGLRKIIKEHDFEVLVNKIEQAKSIVKKIETKVVGHTVIASELKEIMILVGSHPTFNDYLNSILNNVKGLDKEYKHSCRVYFDAVSIIRNKVSHSDMTLSENEKTKLIGAKFKNAISKNGELQMTFEGYKFLIADIVQFFDAIYEKF